LNNCSDTFDENTPPVDDPEYISSLGGSIFEGMQSGDSNAVWLMQVKEYRMFSYESSQTVYLASVILISMLIVHFVIIYLLQV
jgi:alpha-N-acetylglucosaminidase